MGLPIPRFLQLLILSALVLLIPSLLYLSHPAHASSRTLDLSWPSKLLGSQGNGGDPQPLPPLEVPHSSSSSSSKLAASPTTPPAVAPLGSQQDGLNSTDLAKGDVIMQKMANATAKAELGRATWHFLHTMTLRFPDHPTPDERATLKQFFHLFARLYPCAECAAHFQKELEELPPQSSSRMAASLWLCTVHNRVNKRLGKPEFPCDKLDETYDCGCGPEKNGTLSALPEKSPLRKPT